MTPHRWVAAQPEGNRNDGLFWAANRALEADPAADLSPLAVAARQAGLADAEVTRTLNSARRTTRQDPRGLPRPSARSSIGGQLIRCCPARRLGVAAYRMPPQHVLAHG
jgi:hypothetical protein